MKLIGKLTILGVFIAVLFLYRTGLTGFISEMSGSSTTTITDANWSGLRDRAYEAYDLSDIDAAIVLLNGYQEVLADELRKHENGQEGLITGHPGQPFRLKHHGARDRDSSFHRARL